MTLVFVLTLLQDVALCAPIVRRAADRPSGAIVFLLAERLVREPRPAAALLRLTKGFHARVFEDVGSALAALPTEGGLVIFPSVSRHPDHRPSHELAAALPSRFVGAALQHGFECIAFNDPAQDPRHAGLACDLACAWFGPERLGAMLPADRPKVLVTGPPMFLDPDAAAWLDSVRSMAPPPPPREGPLLVCENLHGPHVRHAAGEFWAALGAVAARRPVTLRPHPAGDVARGTLEPPPGVSIDDRPIADAALFEYGLAVSTPSTVVIDLIRHDVPVAVWRDAARTVRTGAYGALPRVTEASEWLDLLQAPPPLPDQRRFVRDAGFPSDPVARFDGLLAFAADLG